MKDFGYEAQKKERPSGLDREAMLHPTVKEIAMRIRKWSRTPVAQDDVRQLNQMMTADNVPAFELVNVLLWLETRVADTNLRFTSIKAFRKNWERWHGDYMKDPLGGLAEIEVTSDAAAIRKHLIGFSIPPALQDSIEQMIQKSLDNYLKLLPCFKKRMEQTRPVMVTSMIKNSNYYAQKDIVKTPQSFILRWFGVLIDKSGNNGFDPPASYYVWHPEHTVWKRHIRKKTNGSLAWRDLMEHLDEN